MVEDERGELEIFNDPDPDLEYCADADVAEGLESGDALTCYFIDADTGEDQVERDKLTMPIFQQVMEQISNPQEHYELRKKLISEIEAITGRKLIIYAADIKKPNNQIDLTDKAGFADLLEQVEGHPLDVFLQSPGGSAEAAEQLVWMMREMCPSVRFIIAHTAKSAATMMALSGDSILMGYEAELMDSIKQELLLKKSDLKQLQHTCH